MKITFVDIYKSIGQFNDIDIRDFSIFLGVNGAGKTHLLQAMKNGKISVDGITNERISYFNLQTFLIKNQASITPRSIDDQRLQAWNILTQDNYKKIFENTDTAVKNLVGGITANPYSVSINENAEERRKPLIKNILSRFDEMLRGVQNSSKIRKLLIAGVFNSGKYISEMTQEDFFGFARYDPDDYELLESLSEVFLDYHRKVIRARLPKKEGGEGLDDERLQEMEEHAPWNFVNDMFREFGLVHSITSPEKFTTVKLMDSQALPFQVKLLINGKEIEFEDLSSGEKILCALAITIYQDNQSKFPELLLLDEVDASLHPSMIQYLLNVIENVFIKNNCKVILATHSPTTTALVSEDSLFEIQSGKEKEKIRKISQPDAINILSEGIITFEGGLSRIDKTKSLQIVTEGYNTEHIKKAIEMLDCSLLNRINFLNGNGKDELKNFYNSLMQVKWDTLFPEIKFLFVWDCDCRSLFGKLNESNNPKKFCFEVNNGNTFAISKRGKPTGIENLYPDFMFKDDNSLYCKKSIKGDYGITTEIPDFDKSKFLEKVLRQNDKKIFVNFQPLIDEIKKILNPANNK